jgi:GNAT superfamily N-acetyltransferase
MTIDVHTAPYFTDPDTGFELRPLAASDDPMAAPILAEATGENTVEAAHIVIERARTGGNDRVIGGWLNDQLIGAYTIERDGMANQVTVIAVAPAFRRQGFGRMMLLDALRRSGRRPLTAETDDDALGFYKACGFKMVGRRKYPSGVFRYRVGWHAPRQGATGDDNC